MSDQAHAADLQATLAGIDRDLAESAKLREETRKFVAEAHKLDGEQRKLLAEAAKLDRDRWLAPWLAITVLIGAIISIVANLPGLLRMAGWVR